MRDFPRTVISMPPLLELCENAETQVDNTEYVEVSVGEVGIKRYIIDMI
jgi:hypothetical protein